MQGSRTSIKDHAIVVQLPIVHFNWGNITFAGDDHRLTYFTAAGTTDSLASGVYYHVSSGNLQKITNLAAKLGSGYRSRLDLVFFSEFPDVIVADTAVALDVIHRGREGY